jgi:hypothetical protein
MGKGQGNGEARRRPGPAASHHYNHLESRAEKRARLMLEAEKRIAELERQLTVSKRVASSAIALLAPYAASSKGGRQ